MSKSSRVEDRDESSNLKAGRGLLMKDESAKSECVSNKPQRSAQSSERAVGSNMRGLSKVPTQNCGDDSPTDEEGRSKDEEDSPTDEEGRPKDDEDKMTNGYEISMGVADDDNPPPAKTKERDKTNGYKIKGVEDDDNPPPTKTKERVKTNAWSAVNDEKVATAFVAAVSKKKIKAEHVVPVEKGSTFEATEKVIQRVMRRKDLSLEVAIITRVVRYKRRELGHVALDCPEDDDKSDDEEGGYSTRNL